MRTAFSGFGPAEPLVGEVVGLRTFRVDESGLLLPLYSDLAWYDGTNTATCAPPTGDRPSPHAVPDPECECGFYAYGTEAAAAHNRQSRYVQAVVSCWGGVVAGTRGVRAEHARIDAIWLHPNVPAWARRRVAARYPSARVYADRAAMLAEHPLSELPGYRAEPQPATASRALLVGLGTALLTIGVLPSALLASTPVLHGLWLAVTAATGLFAAWLLLGSHSTGHFAAAVVAGGVFAWCLAPAFGIAGWLLRAPLLRALAVGAGAYLLSLRPGYFPIEHGRRVRAFCGVRP